MRVQRVDVTQNLPRFLKLFTCEHLAAHHEAHSTPRVHHVAANAAIQVLVAGDRTQHLAGQRIRHIARQHLRADLFKVDVNALKRVGRILGIRVEQLEQHLFGVFNQSRRPARPHAQQAKHGHILVVNGKQHALAFEVVVDQVQDKGHPHRAWVVLVGHQKVRPDVQLTVVFFVKTSGLFDVFIHRVFRNRQPVVLLDPAFFFQRWRFEVNPDRLKLGQLLQRFDLFLKEAAIGQRENVEHGGNPDGLHRSDPSATWQKSQAPGGGVAQAKRVGKGWGVRFQPHSDRCRQLRR